MDPHHVIRTQAIQRYNQRQPAVRTELKRRPRAKPAIVIREQPDVREVNLTPPTDDGSSSLLSPSQPCTQRPGSPRMRRKRAVSRSVRPTSPSRTQPAEVDLRLLQEPGIVVVVSFSTPVPPALPMMRRQPTEPIDVDAGLLSILKVKVCPLYNPTCPQHQPLVDLEECSASPSSSRGGWTKRFLRRSRNKSSSSSLFSPSSSTSSLPLPKQSSQQQDGVGACTAASSSSSSSSSSFSPRSWPSSGRPSVSSVSSLGSTSSLESLSTRPSTPETLGKSSLSVSSTTPCGINVSVSFSGDGMAVMDTHAGYMHGDGDDGCDGQSKPSMRRRIKSWSSGSRRKKATQESHESKRSVSPLEMARLARQARHAALAHA
eukprot:m.192847 g.192847  ORF g.192847 m.192847 type:complete len:374 (+) comp14866_c1_seq1:650-1771(+)